MSEAAVASTHTSTAMGGVKRCYIAQTEPLLLMLADELMVMPFVSRCLSSGKQLCLFINRKKKRRKEVHELDVQGDELSVPCLSGLMACASDTCPARKERERESE